MAGSTCSAGAASCAPPRWWTSPPRPGLDLAAAATLLAIESNGGRNVWGSDGVSTGGIYVKGSGVTQAAYLRYKAARSRLGAQGVGPTQLTSPGLQDRADARGGAWDWRVNCAVGFEILAEFVARYGMRGGFRAYNGTSAYADDAMRRHAEWTAALATARGENMLENHGRHGHRQAAADLPGRVGVGHHGEGVALRRRRRTDHRHRALVRPVRHPRHRRRHLDDRRAPRPLRPPGVELPDGTTQVDVQYQFTGGGVIALETQSR